MSELDMDKIAAEYDRDGFVRIREGLIAKEEFAELKEALTELENNGTIDTNSQTLQNLNDSVFLHPAFEKLARNPKVIALIEKVLNNKFDLQHSKMINKYLTQGANANIKWHQDYPFFPHTNYDLVALALHFDDEPDEAGPINFLTGTHKIGIIPHNNPETGEFMYQITDPNFKPEDYERVSVNCNAGDITLHHGNVIHASAPNNGALRRVFYLQFRAIDAMQFAGVIWKSTGFSPYANPPKRDFARFVDGTKIDVRSFGKIFDKYGRLAPDEATHANISTY